MLSRVDSFTHLSAVLKAAVALGDDMVMLLKYGGKNLFALIDKFGSPTVKRFAVYGEGAVNLLEKVPAGKLLNDIQMFLKHTGDIFYRILKLALTILEYLLPILVGLLGLTFAMIKKGFGVGAQLIKHSVDEPKVSVSVSEAKSSPQENF